MAEEAETQENGTLRGDIFTRYTMGQGTWGDIGPSIAGVDRSTGRQSATQEDTSADEGEGPGEREDFWDEEGLQDGHSEYEQDVNGTTWNEMRDRYPEELEAFANEHDGADTSSEAGTLSEELHRDLSAASASADVPILEQLWLKYGVRRGAQSIVEGGGTGDGDGGRKGGRRTAGIAGGDGTAQGISTSPAVLFEKAVNKLRPVTPLMVAAAAGSEACVSWLLLHGACAGLRCAVCLCVLVPVCVCARARASLSLTHTHTHTRTHTPTHHARTHKCTHVQRAGQDDKPAHSRSQRPRASVPDTASRRFLIYVLMCVLICVLMCVLICVLMLSLCVTLCVSVLVRMFIFVCDLTRVSGMSSRRFIIYVLMCVLVGVLMCVLVCLRTNVWTNTGTLSCVSVFVHT